MYFRIYTLKALYPKNFLPLIFFYKNTIVLKTKLITSFNDIDRYFEIQFKTTSVLLIVYRSVETTITEITDGT